ncbi:hypothetical protein [Allobaculum sp. JKK-2023]|uniref:hypothetical protein n=1 Tax=Allobaculum sp. JKK-2023 TaxID=3108943 RepID=UPI002B0527C6|nr:hypothetical protein [Allobaculum sp. JKK-2023]
MDKTLEAKLAEIKDQAEKINAYNESIADKEQMLNALKTVSGKLNGLPTAAEYTTQAIALLEEEIKIEKLELKALKESE